jgi:tetratricopeptide (TPR) repeat protein
LTFYFVRTRINITAEIIIKDVPPYSYTRMKRTRQQVLEEESRRALKNILPAEWIPRDLVPDYGLDMEITIVEGEEVTNGVFAVQLKATDRIVDNQGMIPLRIKSQYLKDYEIYPLPVFILYYIKLINVFYYVFAQKYIKENLSLDTPAWRNQKYATIRFSPHSILKNIENFKSAVLDSSFYVTLSQLNLKPGGAVYFLDGIPQSDDEELKRLTLLALSYSQTNRHQLAIQEFEHILRVCTASPSERMALLLSLGNAYYSISQYENALKNFRAANNLTSKVRDTSVFEGKAIALNGIGLIYANKGRLDGSRKYFQKAIRIFRKIGYREAEAGTLNNIGTVYRIQGELKKAMARYRLALKIHKETGNRRGQAAVLGNVGNVYQDKDNLRKALEYYREALEIHRDVGYREGEADNLGSIGTVYGKRDEPKEAMAHLRMALKIFSNIGNREKEATTLGSIGIVYRMKGEGGKSMKYQQLALEINRQIGNREGEAIDLGNIGSLYLDEGELGEALRNYRAALKIFKKIGDTAHIKMIEQEIAAIRHRVVMDELVGSSRIFIFYREK